MTDMGGLYVFIGPPGAGKGSLARLCSEKLGFMRISTGDLCRWHIKKGTKTGKAIDFALKSGKLVSDGLVLDMVEGRLCELGTRGFSGVILDGYPRTAQQVHDLDCLLGSGQLAVSPTVVHLMISEDMVVARLNSRYVCDRGDCQAVYSTNPASGCTPGSDMCCTLCGSKLVRRVDDQEEAVRERLRVYRCHEEELLDACRKAGWPCMPLKVERVPLEVFQDFTDVIRRVPLV